MSELSIPTLPDRVRAARIHAFGDPDQLRVETIPVPDPRPGDVLVRVAFAGLNPLDYKLRDGSSAKAKNLSLPAVLGREMAGTVLGAAPDVDLQALGMPVGTHVFGVRPTDDWRGTYTEVVAFPATALAPAPVADREDLAPYGALALVGATAIAAIQDAHLVGGERVLVHGGSGGVGQLLIPLLVRAGAGRVWATGRAANAVRIAQLGATPIPYDEADWRTVVREGTGGRGLDVIIDTHYFETFAPSLDALAPEGRIVVLPTLADLSPARERGIEAHIPTIAPDREQLEELAAGLADGTLPLEVARVLPLEDVARGHEQLETGHTRGKIVLAL